MLEDTRGEAEAHAALIDEIMSACLDHVRIISRDENAEVEYDQSKGKDGKTGEVLCREEIEQKIKEYLGGI